MKLHYVWVMFQRFLVDNMKNTELCGCLYTICLYDFSVDYANIDVDDILDIDKYLMKKHNIK